MPGGSGKLVMQTNVLSETAAAGATAATRVAQYSGVKVQVAFTGGGKTLTMEELSGGQKTMAALCLIFASSGATPRPSTSSTRWTPTSTPRTAPASRT